MGTEKINFDELLYDTQYKILLYLQNLPASPVYEKKKLSIISYFDGIYNYWLNECRVCDKTKIHPIDFLYYRLTCNSCSKK